MIAMSPTTSRPDRRSLLALLLLAPGVASAQVSDHPSRWSHAVSILLRKVTVTSAGNAIEATLEFTAGRRISEADALLMRFGDEKCIRLPRLKDAAGLLLTAAGLCRADRLASTWSARSWDIKLQSHDVARVVLHFDLPSGAAPRAPFDLEIPFHYAISGEEDRPPAIHAGIATLRWGG